MTDPADVFDDGEGAAPAAKPAAKKRAPKKATSATGKSATGGRATTTDGGRVVNTGKGEEKRYRILLEENQAIPPNGQFISANGRSFLLVPGVEVEVPEIVLSVLNDAIEKRPVLEDGRVVGWRDALRYPYRLLSQ